MSISNGRGRKRATFEVIRKVQVSEDLMHQRVLVTRNVRNRAGVRFPGGEWFLANEPRGATAATVVGYGTMTWQGQEMVSLHTTLGEVRMTKGTAVIVDKSSTS